MKNWIICYIKLLINDNIECILLVIGLSTGIHFRHVVIIYK